jgi:hypothetical protein
MKKQSEKLCLNFLLALSVAVLLVGGGCTSTVTPNNVTTHETGFSGNEANGGFVGFAPDGQGIITERAKTKYNALIEIYGKEFLPPISKDFGLTTYTNGTSLITGEALSNFMLMNQWYKNGKKPQ